MEEHIEARYWISTTFPLQEAAESMAGEPQLRSDGLSVHGHPHDCDGAEQARLEQRRVGPEGSVVEPRILLFGIRLLVANNAIRPEVRNLNLDVVHSRLQHVRHVNLKGCLPKDLVERPAIDRDLGDFLHLSEIQEQLLSRLEPAAGRFNVSGVGSGT